MILNVRSNETMLTKNDFITINNQKYLRIDLNMWSYNENESYDVTLDFPFKEFLKAYQKLDSKYKSIDDFLYQVYMSNVEISDDLQTVLKYFAQNHTAFYGEYLCDLPSDIVNKYPVKNCKDSIE